MSHNHPQREFAVEVVQRLRDAGFQAYWAGGCVRDGLLGRTPKDYDVATDARPEQIREVFGRRKTIAIGAAFGVITVIGRKPQGQIEVATFRQDATYSDGRHPDSVTFSTPRHDAQRRDFTINGLFYDPLEDRVIDFVGGQEDLRRRVIRAIGVPDDRIKEDKLRLLRVVRFAATYEFDLDAATLDAVRRHAEELSVVSAERIAEELRRMLAHAHRARAVELLRDSGLLTVILPEFDAVAGDAATWERTLSILKELGAQGTFPSALAALLRETGRARLPPSQREGAERHGSAGASPSHVESPLHVESPMQAESPSQVIETLAHRWRLSNEELRRASFLLTNEASVLSARQMPWPQLQRILIDDDARELVDYCSTLARVIGEHADDIDLCQAKLALPPKKLNPPPLINGNDLQAAGIPPGKAYKRLLTAVREAQLEGRVTAKQAALRLARQMWEATS